MKTEQIAEGSHVMTIREFKRDVVDGALIDYDGFGYMSDGAVMFTDFEIVPSDVKFRLAKMQHSKFMHVVWFNR